MNEGDQPFSKKQRSSATPGTMGGTAAPKGTLYVTVGPQCAGKTTILKNIFGTSGSFSNDNSSGAGVDVTIDDQELVYIPVPTSYFLQDSSSSGTDHEYSSPNQPILYGKTIQDRIHDPSNDELVLVLMRLGGTIGAEEFALRLKGRNNGDTFDEKAAHGDLIDAMDHVIQLHSTGKEKNEDKVPAPLPKAIDLFIVESIFNPRPLELLQQTRTANLNTSESSEALSALDQALHLLKTHAVNPEIHPSAACLSWGNTNTRPREFQSALEAAALSGRTVEFIVFGGMEACEMIRERMSRREYRKMSQENETVANKENFTEMQRILSLPKVDRKTLFVRNLQRLLETGRYIPSHAIGDAMIRVESLLAEAVAKANKDYPNEDNDSGMDLNSAKFRLDYELAKLAGYHLNPNRTVSSVNVTHESSRSNKNPQSTWNIHRPRSGDGRSWQPPAGYQHGRGYDGRGERLNPSHISQGRQQITSNNNSGRGRNQVNSNRPRSGGGQSWQPPAVYRGGGGDGGRGERSNPNRDKQERQRNTSSNNSVRGYDQAYRDYSRQAWDRARENNYYQSHDGGDNYQGREGGRKRGNDCN
ncbi:hypothetical protein ACHAW5_006201 [Stephanodiscus triporus]|uniref:G domain-containing protein n=1 Tax=Stephanodiscus triporus TaxID=2934178 RepID=A0ABD3MUW2_9STRA